MITVGILLNRQPEHEKYRTIILMDMKEGNVEKVYLDNSDQILVVQNGETFITDNPRTENFKEFL